MTDQRYIHKPIAIIQDKRLTPVGQDYLCLIASLQNNGGCNASNNWFANYFGVKRQTAQEHIGSLKKKGFIDTFEEKSCGKTLRRTIRIIDLDSRKALLTDSRRNTIELAGNSDKNSRKVHTHKLKENKRKTTNNSVDGDAEIRDRFSNEKAFDEYTTACGNDPDRMKAYLDYADKQPNVRNPVGWAIEAALRGNELPVENSKVCSIDGCDKPMHRRSSDGKSEIYLCEDHYKDFEKHKKIDFNMVDYIKMKNTQK